MRARDFYEMEAEQSEDEAVSDDEEEEDDYDEYEGMTQSEVRPCRGRVCACVCYMCYVCVTT